ncbi:indole-3-glycerol phosphate synthase TrpC [Novispirillum itersonii]|uniref:indole-3-glycerol phosphate synthase TrpC n=1 Tax=Novispirillum itersonii TaxID=189 RepID=UPI00036B2CFC|nr:indole-3-glycerol phosphate synthase TrpC [Novispirillum itersonii]
MSDVLTRICDTTRAEVARRIAARPLAEVEAAARTADAPRGFANALTRHVGDGRYGLICEIKKASPSAGLIRADFDPAVLARAYAAGGASCLSVLTDGPFFQGHDDYLIAARAACTLPVLRKDFMVDPYQIVEARALSADCILLIMAALSDAQAKEMEDLALSLGMDVLIEVHDAEELDRALTHLRSPLIGVNNRNLKTLKTDIATTELLAARVPADRVLVSESGLYARSDLDRMAEAGARRFLIGESLMRQPDVTAAVQALLQAA